MKLAFLYGGQGSQVKAMGLDFYEREKIAYDYYNSLNLDKDIKDLSFYSDDEILKRTDNTQVVLIAYEIMITKLLNNINIFPDAVAGLSIGEFAALYAAKVLSEEDTIKIAQYRGNIMNKISEGIDFAMFAVIGMKEEDLNNICKEVSSEDKVYISNINTKNQIVISGKRNAVKRTVEKIESSGKKAIELNVSGAFHTEYMNEAFEDLKNLFENINFNNEEVDLYYNLMGNKRNNEDIKTIMAEQVRKTVRFQDIIENMIEDGIDTFIEIGYGDVIKSFVKKINRKVKVYSISDYKSYEDLKGVLNE